ncbi:hypothetical protein OESDEN_12071 [Oesophagostomum dentatum]|uniref:Uncharacterized protein n=1 Tax=Oesophagostomum dentatum TaxID=61180 RepID=A0A0B1SXD7_OESDE|nr:hypothetical protein OESDEN_12071 [Oesophagostomum dentatum]
MCDVGFLAKIALLLVLHIWAVLASIHDFSKAQTLLVLLGILWVAFLYQMCGSHITSIGDSDCWRRLTDLATDVKSHRWTPILVCALVAICLAVFLSIDTSAERSRLFGLTGIVFFILLLTMLSTNRSKVFINTSSS